MTARAVEVLQVPAQAARMGAPEPLRRPVPPPVPYPIAELGPVLAPACEALRRVIQAPDAICGASLLAAAALAVQGLADVVLDGRITPLSLWFLTVGESGERKSAVDDEAMRPGRDFEKLLTVEYTAADALHQSALEEWEARREAIRTAGKKRNGEGIEAELQRLGPAPLAPLRPTVIAADFTAEGLARLLMHSRPSLGAFTDEAALVFGGHGMTKESTARTAATLSKLWDNGTLDRIRAADGAVKLWGRRLSLHLMGQPVIVERALSDDVLAGQGFLARCLLAWPDSTAGTRPYVAANLRTDPAMLAYAARSAELLALPLPIPDAERIELQPRVLTLAATAVAAWTELHNLIEREMAAGGRYATVKPWASKTPQQCLRIAGVLALFEDPDVQEIGPAVIERAAELALWHLDEAVRLAGTAQLPPQIRDAEAVLNWCHDTGRQLLHSTAALQFGPARVRTAAAFRAAMAELESTGWAHRLEGTPHVDGKPRRHAWQIVAKPEGGA